MTPYFILLIAVIGLSTLVYRGGSLGIYRQNAASVTIFIVLVLFAGLRDSSVGTDTNNYVYFFYEQAGDSLFHINSSYEIGFAMLSNIARAIYFEFWSLLLLIAGLTVYLNLKVIRSLSENFTVSLFLYICLGLYVFFFNGARQGIAIAFFGIAIVAAYRNSLWQYVFWVFVAFLFHKTAIVGLFLFYFLRNGFNIKNIGVNLILFTLFFYGVITGIQLEGSEFEKFETYIDRGALGGGGFTFYNTAVLVFLISVRNQISSANIKKYDFFLNLVMVGTLIFLFTFILGLDVNIMRLAFYFLLGQILIWPLVFKDVNLAREIVFKIVFVLVHLFYLFMILSQSGLSLYIPNRYLFGIE